jgi:hypothetical protein
VSGRTYSPKCLEGKFSEVHLHDPLKGRAGVRSAPFFQPLFCNEWQ